jgi:hypothetical protein
MWDAGVLLVEGLLYVEMITCMRLSGSLFINYLVIFGINSGGEQEYNN